MDYKKSLNLPKTEFPMKANLSKREPGQLKNWEDTRLYELVRKTSKGREKFIHSSRHQKEPLTYWRQHSGGATGAQPLHQFPIGLIRSIATDEPPPGTEW